MIHIFADTMGLAGVPDQVVQLQGVTLADLDNSGLFIA
jgi:hypothetical protein